MALDDNATVESAGTQMDSPADFNGRQPNKEQSDLARWRAEIARAKRYFKDYHKRADLIQQRFRGETKSKRNGSTHGRKYNVLWSLIRTMAPNVFEGMPRIYVERTHRDKSQIGLDAAQILERVINYGMDNDTTYEAMADVVQDYLLYGRGVPWVRYKPEFELRQGDRAIRLDVSGMREDNGEAPPPEAAIQSDATGKFFSEPFKFEEVTHEETVVDHIAVRDFLHGPATKWHFVPWMGKRVFMTREELVNRFGEEIGKAVPLKYSNRTGEADRENKTDDHEGLFKTAEVVEVWDLTSRTVMWICPDYPDRFLDRKADPLRLPGFFPVPKPLFDTMTSDTLIPVPMFAIIQDICDELDELTLRISLLTQAMRVVALYDGSMGEIVKRLTTETRENDMIPVDNFASLAEAGGLKEAIMFLPIEQIIVVVEKLYQRRETVLKELYDITGISDIVRGDSDPRETASAQKIKSGFASKRLKSLKRAVARVARQLLEIKAEIVCAHYDDASILAISGAQDFIVNEKGDYDPVRFNEALAVLRSKPTRHFMIRVDNEMLSDDMDEKQDRMEFLQAFSKALEQAMPMMQMAPQLAHVFKEMVMFAVRAFPISRSVESAIDRALEDFIHNLPPPQDKEKKAGKTPEELEIEHRKLDIQEQQVGIARLAALSSDQKRQDEFALKQMEMDQFERLKRAELGVRTGGEQLRAKVAEGQQKVALSTAMLDSKLAHHKELRDHQLAVREQAMSQLENDRSHAVDVAQMHMDEAGSQQSGIHDLVKIFQSARESAMKRDFEKDMMLHQTAHEERLAQMQAAQADDSGDGE